MPFNREKDVKRLKKAQSFLLETQKRISSRDEKGTQESERKEKREKRRNNSSCSKKQPQRQLLLERRMLHARFNLLVYNSQSVPHLMMLIHSIYLELMPLKFFSPLSMH